MVQTKADILVVDDLKKQGDIVTGHIKERRGYRVFSPESLSDLIMNLPFVIYEGVLIDVVWEEWKPPVKLKNYKKKIHDGIDFARFIFDINPKLAQAIALYSSVAQLGDPSMKQRIKSLPFVPKLISTPFSWKRTEAKKEINPLLDEASKVHRFNPLIQSPELSGRPINTRFQVYKSVVAEYSKWTDFSFETIGDYAWAVICGSNMEKDYYGMPLNGGHNGFDIKHNDHYPSAVTLSQLSKRRHLFPFILWNTRKPEFLDAQFELAGPQLTKIPEQWRSFFGIAMARQCPYAYLGGQDHKVLKWCRELDEYGRIEVPKQIYKLLRQEDPSHIEKFARRCEAQELPVIADVLTGKVESINREHKDEDKWWAKVVMWTHGGDSFIETFNLKRLSDSNINFPDTRFEYTVYQRPRGEVTALIEPCDPDEVKYDSQ